MPVTADVSRLAGRSPVDADALRLPAAHAGDLTAVAVAQMPLSVWESSPPREYHKGEVVYGGGEPAEFAFAIESGLVALTLAAHPERERIVALAGPGDIVGALTPATDRYLETATALSAGVRCRLLARPGATADDAPDLAAALAVAAGRQLARLADAMADNEVAVPARVARTLVRLGERFGQRGAEGMTRITLPLTHDTLAAMIGAARETTTSVVQTLRERGLLTGTRGRYLFSPEKLAAFACESL